MEVRRMCFGKWIGRDGQPVGPVLTECARGNDNISKLGGVLPPPMPVTRKLPSRQRERDDEQPSSMHRWIDAIDFPYLNTGQWPAYAQFCAYLTAPPTRPKFG